MTPDQWQQVILEVGSLAGAVIWGGHRRKRISVEQCESEEDHVQRLETEGQLMREEMAKTREEMTRLKVRIESGERFGEQLREEMHALSGRVDAANEKYTELLQSFKNREKSSQTTQIGDPKDLQDQTKTTIKGGKKDG